MPDEGAQAPEEIQDTPINDDAPQTGDSPESPEDSKPTVDYQQRYESLVPEYTRGQQLLAAARGEHGPEAQMQALQQLGVEVQQEEEAEEEIDPFEDPTDRLAREMDAMKADLASRDEQEQQKQFQKLEREYIDTTLSGIEDKENVKLSARDKDFVETKALANRMQDGRPDLEGAVSELIELRKEAHQQYVESKKAPKPPVGAVGEEKIDFLKDPEASKQWMVEDFARRKAEQGES